MPRGKKAKTRRGHSTLRSSQGHPKLETTFVPFKGTPLASRAQHALTLQEEARNTERHQSFWNSDQRLRDTKVNFVSAGTLESTRPKDAESSMAKMSLEDPTSEDQGEIEVIEEIEEDKEHLRTEASQKTESMPNFFVDTRGTATVRTGLPAPQLRSLSPTPSNSSEEVILFGGRDALGRGLSRGPQRLATRSDSIDVRIRVVEDKIHEQEELLGKVLRHRDKLSPRPRLEPSAQDPSCEDNDISHKKVRQSSRPKKCKLAKDEDSALADYIAHMDPEELELSQFFGARDLGGTDDDLWQETEASSGEPVSATNQDIQSRWNRSDLEDFDDLSTSDGVMGEVQAILSKRDRHRGIQYLVIWDDQTADEARWVPATTLTSLQAISHIETFEAAERLVPKYKDLNEDTSDSEEIDDVASEGCDQSEDDTSDLLDEKIAAMSDETMARLLAKQEELGMGSDTLLLFDDDDDADEEELGTQKHLFGSIMLGNKRGRMNARGSKRPRGDFPSATILADAYDGFDVMDFERPSLKPKVKGRRGKVPVDMISDSEFEASMQLTWENDRSRKSKKKQEREDLRAQGLLGKKNGKPDLKQKYKEVMSLANVKQEIKIFLTSENTTLALPPMSKQDRKHVHDLANAFNLKSKSIGSGNTRFPILTKTSRTSLFTDAAFEAVSARLNRRFFPRMDIAGKRIHGGNSHGGRGGGFNSAAVSYRDGDIVGGSAPELGSENRGHAMLEKMGWSSGTALGAVNNKGIMQPVTHVVKTTKAGLG